MKQIPYIKHGDELTVEWLNSLVDAANGTVINVDPTSGLEMTRSSSGTNIRYARRTTSLAKNGGSTIAARSGTTVGSGSVTLYTIRGTTLTSMSKTVTAYNMTNGAVAANAYLQLKMIDGRWFVDTEGC